MKKGLITLLLLLVTGFVTGLASTPIFAASSSMRCGDRLIMRNDHVSKIERFCGEPESYVSTTTYKTRSRWDHFYHTYFYEEIPVILEEMVFNFGPNKFMRLVKIENGIVKRVETLGYGFRD